MPASLDLQGIEAPLRETIAYIVANDTAKAAEVQTRMDAAHPSATLTLSGFDRVTFEDPREALVTGYPTLFVVPDRARVTSWSTSALLWRFQVEFAIIASGSDEADAKARAWRYLIVLAELLKEFHDTTVSGREPIWGSGETTEVYYLPTYTTEDDEMVSDLRLITSMEYRERG